MAAQQIITPNPNVPCTPGYCLKYVRESFDLPAAYPSATAAWVASASQHQDWDFPEGVWLPVWFSIDTEPNGHAALLAPDGSVYSSSDMTNTPHHHPSIDDLISYYARWGKMQLTYLGWTEDVAGYPVITNFGGIAAQGTITSQEDFMGGFIDANQAEDIIKAVVDRVVTVLDGNIRINPSQAEDIVQATVARINATADGKTINAQQADDIALAAAHYTEEKK